MSVEVRRCASADQAAVRAVLTDAFGDDGTVADLAEALRARADNQASFVATHDGQVIGHTHLSISWVDAPTRLVEVLTLSPLGVTPRWQSQGVGRSLLTAAIRAAEGLAAPLVFLEGDPAYYSRHGWLPAAPLGFDAPSTRIPTAGFQVMQLPAYEPATMHGRLIYNDTFWTFDRVGLRD